MRAAIRSLFKPIKPTGFTPSSRIIRTRSNISNIQSKCKLDDIRDVIIIGGGPTGLFLSSLLTSYQINSHLLFDKRPKEELLQHPQAHFINIRSMEILRAEMPRVYDGIRREMPGVSEWERFHFGGSVITSSGRTLGKVVHPVKEPLRVGQSGNAILLPKDETHSVLSTAGGSNSGNTENYISVCKPAHLAQNKFISLLLEEAKQRDESTEKSKEHGNHLRYGEEVIAINEIYSEEEESQTIITIRTSHGHSYRTRYLIAADGVRSFARKSFGIAMVGENAMQNLINVHFRTNSQLSNILMENNNQAMLHFVYNSQLVGAFVCHDGNKGEWVLQIPFFPPYQSMDDFSVDKIRDMIWAGLGLPRSHEDLCDFDVLSIRPWTMSSLVAQSYLNKSNNMVLVGDAAHAFPPAGGFGMNSGLQDAQNLAWRLAFLLRSSNYHNAKCILTKYESDRKPIASQNAALSVRNFIRTLRIAKACYLDAQHPALLTTMLGSPPMNLLPLEMRQDMFRRLVSVAMMPLASLNSSGASLHANHIERNVRSILESGGSLPLVFPKYEIGFSYEDDKHATQSMKAKDDDDNDTSGYYPRIKVGHRLPHVIVEVMRSSISHTRNDWLVLETITHQAETNTDPLFITLTDISSQLRRVFSYDTPVFTVLILGHLSFSSLDSIRIAVDKLSSTLNTPLILVNILPEAPSDLHDNCRDGVIALIDSQQVVWNLMLDEPSIIYQSEHDSPSNAIVLVRPDGHIGGTSWVNFSGKENDAVQKVISQGLEEVLGFI